VEDFLEVLNKIENELGSERLNHLHCHFSRIEFTKGGEKKHWTIDDVQFGPEFEHLAGAIHIKQMEPVIICESRDRMAEDALKLKKIYECVAGVRT
jgi:deoxyribonuclease-4